MPPRGNGKGPEPESTLEQLKRLLYSPKITFRPSAARTPLKNASADVARDWPTDEFERSVQESRRYDFKQPSSMIRKFLIIASIFCVVALVLAALIFFFGGNVVAGNKISLNITGPVSIEAGSPLSYRVSVENDNAGDLQNVDLSVSYPSGSSGQDGSSRDSVMLADIPAHGVAEHDFEGVLYGNEDSIATVTVAMSYQVTGSNALFTKEKDYPVEISSAPLTLSATGPTQATAGEPFSFNVNVGSNASTPINNVLLKIDYPFGFTINSSTPSPESGGAVWDLGTLTPGEQESVVVNGVLSGSSGDSETFRFSAGPQSATDPNTIDPVFVSTASNIALEEPFIGLSMAVNGDTSGQYAAPAGEPVTVDVHYQSNATVPIQNASIAVALSGDFDPSSVEPESGFYQSSDNTITWDSSTISALGTVAPGAEGDVTFTLTPTIASGATNPAIALSGSVQGQQTGESGVPSSVDAESQSTIRVASNLTLLSAATFATGPFTNTGPLPPKVGSPTSYTITLTANNSANDISHGQVTATLPSYVTFLQTVSPSGSDVEVSGQTLTWNLSDLPAGQNGSVSSQSVSFQVSLLPSLSQVGTDPTLLSDIVLTGQDQYAGANLKVSAPDLTTNLSTDPSFAPADGVVSQ